MRGGSVQGAGSRGQGAGGSEYGDKVFSARYFLSTVACCLLLLVVAGCGGGDKPKPGPVVLNVSAKDSSGNALSAKVLVSSEEKGTTPIEINYLTPGTYTVLLQSVGYKDYTESVVLQQGQTTTVTATMETVVVPEGPVFSKRGLTPFTVFTKQ